MDEKQTVKLGFMPSTKQTLDGPLENCYAFKTSYFRRQRVENFGWIIENGTLTFF